jgi:hypothetical protein
MLKLGKIQNIKFFLALAVCLLLPCAASAGDAEPQGELGACLEI